MMRIQDQEKDLSMLGLDVHDIARLAASNGFSQNLFAYTVFQLQLKNPIHPLTLAAVNQASMLQDKLDSAYPM